MKKSGRPKGFTILEIILVIALVFILVGIGWYVYMQRAKTENKNTTTNSSNESPTDSSNENSDPASKWVSYTKNNLNFKYPPDWTLEEQAVGPIIASPDYKSTGVQITTVTSGIRVIYSQTTIPQKDITAENYLSTYYAYQQNCSVVVIREKKAVQCLTDDDKIGTIFFRSDGTRIEVSAQYSDANKQAALDNYNSLLNAITVN